MIDASKAGPLIMIVALTTLSGIGDAQGFVHAARVWAGGHVVWREVAASALGYAFGAAAYWLAIRFLNQLGVSSPEVQTLGWFAVTILGVALFSGDFSRWQAIDRLVAVGVLAGVGWLIVRTEG